MKALTFLLVVYLVISNCNSIIFDFNRNSNMSSWMVVDDGVMGGLSKGSIRLNDQGHGVFSGYVTTENNGGFSSIRHSFKQKDVSEFTHVILKIKGDGKEYEFRLKKSRFDRESYINTFKTTGEWETKKIPLKDLYPSFRGYKSSKPNFDGISMEEITILIANKRREDFRLELDRIFLE